MAMRIDMKKVRGWKFLSTVAACAATAACAALFTSSSASAQTSAQPNIVNNSSFENGNVFWTFPPAPTSSYGVPVLETGDPASIKTGSASLKYTRTLTTQTGGFQQTLMVSPEDECQIDAWVKGSNLAGGTGKGARIYIEYYTAAGGYISGEYLPILSGTFGWTKQTLAFSVPSNADKVKLNMYMITGTTGTVWFDDVEVRVIPPALTSPNLVTNPGFETASPLAWATPTAPSPSTRVTTENHTSGGTASLRIVNTTSPTRTGSSQTTSDLAAANIYEGDIVHLTGWIKGGGLYRLSGYGPNTGVRIFAEFKTATNGYLGGMYPERKVVSTNSASPDIYGWTQLKDAYRVPPGTAKISFGVQMMDGVNGTVYFDDISMQVEKKPLQVFPVYPNYRGVIHTSDTTDFAAKLLVAENGWTGNLTVTQTLINVNSYGNLVHTGTTTTPSALKGEYSLSMNPPALSAGGYYWKILVTDPTGAVHYFFVPIQVVGTMPDVYVDKEGWIRVKNGAVWDKFFMFGLYNQTSPNDYVSTQNPNIFQRELAEIADAGFNTILDTEYGVKAPHAAYVSAAAAEGLKFIYNLDTFHPQMTGWWEFNFPGAAQENADSQAASRIIDYRNHPNLLGWYINDESPVNVTRETQAMYNRVKNLDPNHPTFTMLGDPTQLDNWYNMTDVIGIDKYPVNSVNTNIDELYRVTTTVAAAARGSKGVWAANQVCYTVIPNSVPSVRYWPTQTEFRNQAYMALIAGAKSLIGWTYYDFDNIGTTTHTTHWPKAVGLAADIMGPNPGVSDLIKNGTDLTTVTQAGTPNNNVKFRAFSYQGHVRIMVANAVYSTQQIVLNVPAGYKIDTGQSTQYGTTGTLVGNQLTLSLPSVHSSTYRLIPV
jgi:hypothetical protein